MCSTKPVHVKGNGMCSVGRARAAFLLTEEANVVSVVIMH